MPWVVGLVVVVALGIGAYFLVPGASQLVGGVFGAKMTAADYKAKATQYLTAYDATFGADVSAKMTDLGSTDPQARTAAKAAFDEAARNMRAAMANIRSLRPPAEFEKIQARLVAGVDANEKLLKATEVYVAAAIAAGGDATAIATAAQTYSQTMDSADIQAAMTDFDAARTELGAASSTAP